MLFWEISKKRNGKLRNFLRKITILKIVITGNFTKEIRKQMLYVQKMLIIENG